MRSASWGGEHSLILLIMLYIWERLRKALGIAKLSRLLIGMLGLGFPIWIIRLDDVMTKMWHIAVVVKRISLIEIANLILRMGSGLKRRFLLALKSTAVLLVVILSNTASWLRLHRVSAVIVGVNIHWEHIIFAT